MNRLQSIIEETTSALNAGDTNTALRISGEALAKYDIAWSEAFNHHSDTRQAIECCMLVGTIHVECIAGRSSVNSRNVTASRGSRPN